MQITPSAFDLRLSIRSIVLERLGMNTMRTFGFIGLGLIGGSIARGIKRVCPTDQIMAYARTRSTLEKALADGTIDRILDGIDEHLKECDFIILCTPVMFNTQYLEAVKPFLKPGAILTDVGSTKTNIHKEVTELGLEDYFIGGHPMAGSERTGYEASSDRLLENAYYIITPTKSSSQENIDSMVQLARDLSALPMILDYEEHDYVVAAISHLPHIIASTLINLIKDSDSEEQIMKQVAAGGFKDITRIASSSPIMWQQICIANNHDIVQVLLDYIASLSQIVTDLEEKNTDAIYRLFDTAKEYRNSIPNRSSGPIKKEYSLYCDIIDQAGAIATVATGLAIQQISIKNIGIIHNREFEQGVLKIEFYDEESCRLAGAHLESCNYTVYMR